MDSVRRFIKHMLGNTSRGREQSGVHTTNSTPGGGGSGGNKDGNGRHRRADSSSPHATSSDGATVFEAATEQVFGEHLLLVMRERRAAISKSLFKKKFRDLVRRCQVPGTSVTDMTTLIKAQQADLHRLCIACLRTSDISRGTVLQACMFSCRWIGQYA